MSLTTRLYRVVGVRAFRGHEPGTEFWGRLEPLAEARALSRGSIVVLETIVPVLEPGTYRLPDGWTHDTGGT